MNKIVMGLLVVLLSGGAPAEEAATPDSPAYGKGPCREDIVKLCPGVLPGQGRMATCLAMNRAKVSPQCRETIITAAQSVKNGPCKADIQKFCTGTQPGQGRIRACLVQHKSELSPECQTKVSEGKQRAQGMMMQRRQQQSQQGQAKPADDEGDL